MGALEVAIVGAGPCGLACAAELVDLQRSNWRVFERNDVAGGLAASVVDAAGFTWDLGGHVVFSHFGEFDRLLSRVMGGDIIAHDRSSFIRVRDRWIPYPFQNNLRYLPPEDVARCLTGLIDASGAAAGDFETWMVATFGNAISDLFMRPYNFKVWATPAGEMSSAWIAERVSVVDWRRALTSVVMGIDDRGWGPNSRFSFPSVGGTGEIYRRLARRLGDHVTFDRSVVRVDAEHRELMLEDGERVRYSNLVSTMPLDRLVALIDDVPAAVAAAASRLKRNGVYMVGVGVEEPLGDDRSWLYFPGSDVPFYRATNFAKYSPANVPGGDTSRFSSWMTETSYSEHKHEDPASLGARVVEGLRSSGLIDPGSDVVSVHIEDIPYAYPIPTLDRDDSLAVIVPWLEERSIYPRGRFGLWRYEWGNMDHAVKMGADVARRIIEGREEAVWG